MNQQYQDDREIIAILRDIRTFQRDIDLHSVQQLGVLQNIQILLTKPIPTKMALQFQGELPNMPGQEKDNQTIPCSALETDADGNPVTLNPANVTWAIDDPTVASLVQNADGSASFKALKVGGPTNISCTDNSVSPPLVGTNTLEVVASTKTPTSMALVFGDPQASTN